VSLSSRLRLQQIPTPRPEIFMLQTQFLSKIFLRANKRKLVNLRESFPPADYDESLASKIALKPYLLHTTRQTTSSKEPWLSIASGHALASH